MFYYWKKGLPLPPILKTPILNRISFLRQYNLLQVILFWEKTKTSNNDYI